MSGIRDLQQKADLNVVSDATIGTPFAEDAQRFIEGLAEAAQRLFTSAIAKLEKGESITKAENAALVLARLQDPDGFQELMEKVGVDNVDHIQVKD
ncbi:hypothetical protein [Streptomyces sp. NPDC046261]|uniref:hypothetical protein n=1 Tax=Streptomyces sp. NPDC046261 TaxID=3157200 RepID=UPI0033FE855F